MHLNRGAWLITRVEVNKWGRELIFEAFMPPQPETVFRLVFTNCTRLYWEAMSDEEPHPNDTFTADVIGMDMGEPQHRRQAVITTTLFEVGLTYDELRIEKDW